MIQWNGYRDATWESADKLTGCLGLVNSFISRKYTTKLKMSDRETGYMTPRQQCHVKNPSNPPQQPIISKVELLKVWRGVPLYMVEYSNEYVQVLTSEQLQKSMPLLELA